MYGETVLNSGVVRGGTFPVAMRCLPPGRFDILCNPQLFPPELGVHP